MIGKYWLLILVLCVIDVKFVDGYGPYTCAPCSVGSEYD